MYLKGKQYAIYSAFVIEYDGEMVPISQQSTITYPADAQSDPEVIKRYFFIISSTSDSWTRDPTESPISTAHKTNMCMLKNEDCLAFKLSNVKNLKHSLAYEHYITKSWSVDLRMKTFYNLRAW